MPFYTSSFGKSSTEDLKVSLDDLILSEGFSDELTLSKAVIRFSSGLAVGLDSH